MTATILDGRALAERVRAEIAIQAKALPRKAGLKMILAGDNPASKVYVRNKTRACRQVGIESQTLCFPPEVTFDELAAAIRRLNDDPETDGILLQLPLPARFSLEDRRALLSLIDPWKDVDGLHPENQGLLLQGLPRFIPCTPQGCMKLIGLSGLTLSGARAVIIGRSELVGRPLSQLLMQANATVTVCHSKTKDVAAETRCADLIVSATGHPHLVQGDWVKPGAVVIDVGISPLPGGGLTGDVDFEAVSKRAAAITPVPGGVGPMTITCLLQNAVQAAAQRIARGA